MQRDPSMVTTNADTERDPRRRPRPPDDGDLVPMDLEAGEKIVHERYSGSEVTSGGDPLLILRESDVLAVSD